VSRGFAVIVTLAIHSMTIVYATIGILSLLISPRGKLYLATARLWSRTLIAMANARLSTTGTDRVDWTRPFILMSNHQSHYDIPFLFVATPADLRFLSKHVLAYIPVFGWSMWLAGFIFINRSNQKKAFESIQAAIVAVREGRNIVVFPEGTRSQDGVLKPFKKGAFHLAAKAGVQIVPVYVDGSTRVLPKHAWTPRFGHHVEVRFGEPFLPEVTGDEAESRRLLSERVGRELSKLAATPRTTG
jgi:1-acyl-sn-glycerol-3-phosphate acyltransferase